MAPPVPVYIVSRGSTPPNMAPQHGARLPCMSGGPPTWRPAPVYERGSPNMAPPNMAPQTWRPAPHLALGAALRPAGTRSGAGLHGGRMRLEGRGRRVPGGRNVGGASVVMRRGGGPSLPGCCVSLRVPRCKCDQTVGPGLTYTPRLSPPQRGGSDDSPNGRASQGRQAHRGAAPSPGTNPAPPKNIISMHGPAPDLGDQPGVPQRTPLACPSRRRNRGLACVGAPGLPAFPKKLITIPGTPGDQCGFIERPAGQCARGRVFRQKSN
nr:hypothetical protein [Human alphaherpesvirus 1]